MAHLPANDKWFKHAKLRHSAITLLIDGMCNYKSWTYSATIPDLTPATQPKTKLHCKFNHQKTTVIKEWETEHTVLRVTMNAHRTLALSSL